MTELNVFVQDYNTKEIIGISASGDMSQVPINTPVRLGAFNGIILPIDKNGNVGNEFIRLSEGDYNLIYDTKDSLGREYTKSDYVWVDNTTPELTFEKAPGVYEVDNSQTTFDIAGTSYDKGIANVMNKTQTYLDQSWTNIYKYEHNNFISLDMVEADSNGRFNTIYELNNTKAINKIAMSGIDIFGAGSLGERYDYYVVQNGTPYIYSSFDKTRVDQGDNFNMSVEMNNISNFENGEFKLDYVNNHKILDVKLSDEFKDMAKEQGYEFKVVLGENTQSNMIYNRNMIKIETIIKGKKEFNIDEKVKVFEITLNAKGEIYYNPTESDLFEEALIDSVMVNGSDFENVLNTNFVYSIAK